MLKSNYESMVERFGFSLSDVGDGYAEPYLSEARSEALTAAGFDVAGKLEREYDYFEEQYLITPDTMLDVVMFFFGLGNMVCQWNHTDGCSYHYDKDDQFDNPHSAKHQYKQEYLIKKAAAEKALGRKFKNENEFLKLLRAIHETD